MRSYEQAFETGGRTYAPLRPFVTRAADRIWYEGPTLVIARGTHVVRVALTPRTPDALDNAYVPLAPILRALGARVTYRARCVDVFFAARPVGSPSPYDGYAPSAAPSVVFTPAPIPTPRPVWSGTPLPRRTPLPIVVPTPH